MVEAGAASDDESAGTQRGEDSEEYDRTDLRRSSMTAVDKKRKHGASLNSLH